MSKKILSLLGGGAKGIFTLGVLESVEALMGSPLSRKFDLIAGTSTGAIIAALLSLEMPVAQIIKLYKKHIPFVLTPLRKAERTSRLREMAEEIFKGSRFTECKTRLAVVATNLTHGRPTIFKSYKDGLWTAKETFNPGFGCTIADAVRASCAAYPFFEPVTLPLRDAQHELIDGGFSANDPSLFALLDALGPLGWAIPDIRLATIGTGRFAEARKGFRGWISQRAALRIFANTLETSSCTHEFLISKQYPTIRRCRIPASATDAVIHTSLLETNAFQLDKMLECGRAAYRENEAELKILLR